MTAGLRVEAVSGGDAAGVLQVVDAATGRPATVPPPGRRSLRLRVHLTCPGQHAEWTQARVLVVADVLLRALEAAGVQVFQTAAEPTPGQGGARERLLARFGVHVPEADNDPRADLHVHAGPGPAPEQPGIRVRVGQVVGGTGLPDPDALGPGEDPLARRLALLDAEYGEPLELGPARLLDASSRTAGWRTLVRAWSRSPSTAVPAAVREEARRALAADLDTSRLSALLDQVAEAPGLADGARFESFVWLDRFLGLDLAGALAAP